MYISGIGPRRAAIALSLSAIMAVTLPTDPARADHPVVAAIIGGHALVVAAAIGAAGTVVAASVLAAGGVASTVVEEVGDAIARGETGSGNTDGGDAERQTEGLSKVHLGQDDVPQEFRKILKRKADLSARNGTTANGDGRAMARIDYSVDGDVKRADENIGRIALNDTGTLRFTITNIEDAAQAPLVVTIEELTLSTEDVAKTHGAVEATLTALQDGTAIWDWTLRVEQGKKPVLNLPDAVAQGVSDIQPGHLTIRDLDLAVPYTAPGAGKTSVVEIILSVEGFGARL